MREQVQIAGSGRVRRAIRAIQSIRSSHVLRHSPSGFGFAFADHIDYLDPGRWDQITQGSSILLRRDILRVIEKYGPDNIRPRYALIFRGDDAVAAVAAQVVEFSGDRLTQQEVTPSARGAKQLLKKAVAPLSASAVGRFRDRMLVAGNLLCWGFHGIAFANNENHLSLWPGVADALYRMRRSERLSGQTGLVMIKDLTAAQEEVSSLESFSYRPLATEPNMVLDLRPEWRSYEDYLGALDAKYRRNAKDQMKKLANGGCTVEALTDLSSASAEIHRLYLAVHENASLRLVTIPESYLPALSKTLGGDFKCSVVLRDQKVLGFVTSFKNGDTAVAYYIGFDRSAAAEGLPIYLRLLHETVRHGIEWRCKQLSLGRTALEPKAALGAKAQPMSVWLRHRVQPVNWLIRGILGGVPHGEPPDRNPFKSTKSNEARGSTAEPITDSPVSA